MTFYDFILRSNILFPGYESKTGNKVENDGEIKYSLSNKRTISNYINEYKKITLPKKYPKVSDILCNALLNKIRFFLYHEKRVGKECGVTNEDIRNQMNCISFICDLTGYSINPDIFVEYITRSDTIEPFDNVKLFIEKIFVDIVAMFKDSAKISREAEVADTRIKELIIVRYIEFRNANIINKSDSMTLEEMKFYIDYSIHHSFPEENGEFIDYSSQNPSSAENAESINYYLKNSIFAVNKMQIKETTELIWDRLLKAEDSIKEIIARNRYKDLNQETHEKLLSCYKSTQEYINMNREKECDYQALFNSEIAKQRNFKVLCIELIVSDSIFSYGNVVKISNPFPYIAQKVLNDSFSSKTDFKRTVKLINEFYDIMEEYVNEHINLRETIYSNPVNLFKTLGMLKFILNNKSAM